MMGLDDNGRRIEAERIAEGEIRIVNENPLVIRPNGCVHITPFQLDEISASGYDAVEFLVTGAARYSFVVMQDFLD